MRRCAMLVVLLAGMLSRACAAEKVSRWHTVWHVSQALLAGANTADIASSWGKQEANPLVRTGQRFGYGSMAIKVGALAGALTAQHYLVRRSPQRAAWFASSNLAATGLLSVVAVHNMHVPR